MKIKDKPDFLSRPKPITFYPEDSVRKALDVMCEKNIGSVIVINQDETLAGIITERDMMRRVLGPGLNPDNTKLSEVMSTEIRAANQDDEIVDWMRVMSNERFRHLPIIDENGKLINMMSQGDFVAYTWPDLFEKVKQDVKGRLGRAFQILLVALAVITLGLIAFKNVRL